MADKSIGAVLARGLAPWRHVKGVVESGIGLTNAGFWSNLFGASNWSGQSVTPRSVLQLSTAMACIRLISGTVSTLPLGIYSRGKDGAPVAATGHQLYYLLHSQPNARMTAASFWQAFVASLLLWGNAYVEKRISAGVITSLELLDPRGMPNKPGPAGWLYNDLEAGTVRTIPEERVWRLPAFTLDGITGISPISYGANVFGGAISADKASADTFRNALKSPGLLLMDSTLTAEQREGLRAHVKKVGDQGGVMVMEKGAGFKPLSMNPQDAELLSSREFAIAEICRWFGVPPPLVGHGEKNTSWPTGFEQQMIFWVATSLRQWVVKIEQGIRKDLMSPTERLKYHAEYALEGLLRGDSAARAAFYTAMVNSGIFTRDECRRLENLAAMGGNAAVLTVQSAMLPIDKLGEEAKAPAITAADALKRWLGIADQQKEAA